MELYLLRHGIATPKPSSGRDRDRPLTPEGILGIQNVVLRAQTLGFNPSSIASSPYLRARQSADAVAGGLGFQEPILISARLTPDSSPEELWQEIRESASGSLLLVSHEPLLSAAAAWMTGETRVIIEFYPGTLVRIDFETIGLAPKGQFRWRIDGN